jgi:predicted dehydrogenase
MITAGVVGYGYWGSKHARVLSGFGDVDLAIIDRSPERRTAARLAFPSARVVSNLDEIVEQLDAVVVATPPASHCAVALQAIEHGCHVMVEKPLATSVRDCERLIAAAEDARVVLMVGHTFEYHAAVWKLREIVRSGEIGEVYYLDAARLNLGLYQADVNVVWDLAPHDISIINYLLGREPDTVQAWADRHAGHRTEDVAYLKLVFSNPAVTAYVHVSWLDPRKVRRFTVVGSDKMVVYNDGNANELIRIYDVGVEPTGFDEPDLHNRPMTYRYGDIVSPYVTFDEPLAVEGRTFIDCILSGSRPPTDGESGLAVVRILEAADRSLASGMPATLERSPLASGKQLATSLSGAVMEGPDPS